MDEEVKALFDSGACEFIDRQVAMDMRKDIIKSTWAFCKKRKPSGEVSQHKSRLCAHGDLTKDAHTANEVFAPVADWIAIRMLFALGVVGSFD